MTQPGRAAELRAIRDEIAERVDAPIAGLDEGASR
jgi:hypothetical protein